MIPSIPNELEGLKNLTYLEISGNKISSIPKEIGKLGTLERFSCNSNNLSVIPSEIGQLSKLINLNLTNNKLTSIPSEIGNCKNLDMLTLELNSLSTLPPEIGNLGSLRILWCRRNKISTLPDQITKLKNISGYFDDNALDSNVLSHSVKVWLDTCAKGWRETQNVPVKIDEGDHCTSNLFKILPADKNSTLQMYLPGSTCITLDLLDSKGRMINTVLDSYLRTGIHTVDLGDYFHCNGQYFLRINNKQKTFLRRIPFIQ